MFSIFKSKQERAADKARKIQAKRNAQKRAYRDNFQDNEKRKERYAEFDWRAGI